MNLRQACVVWCCCLSVRVGAAVTPAQPAGTTEATTTADFSRYQVIIDRSPFGQIAAGGAGLPTPNFAARFQFVGLVASNAETGALLQAVIFDKEGNRSYFRSEGELIKSDTDQNGVKVLRIEQTPAAKLVLEQGLEKATLSFAERSTTPGAALPPGVAPPGMNPAGFPQGGGPIPAPPGGRRIPFRRVN